MDMFVCPDGDNNLYMCENGKVYSGVPSEKIPQPFKTAGELLPYFAAQIIALQMKEIADPDLAKVEINMAIATDGKIYDFGIFDHNHGQAINLNNVAESIASMLKGENNHFAIGERKFTPKLRASTLQIEKRCCHNDFLKVIKKKATQDLTEFLGPIIGQVLTTHDKLGKLNFFPNVGVMYQVNNSEAQHLVSDNVYTDVTKDGDTAIALRGEIINAITRTYHITDRILLKNGAVKKGDLVAITVMLINPADIDGII